MDLSGKLPLGGSADWDRVPEGTGVYALSVAGGAVRLGQTRVLRRRLRRLDAVLTQAGRAADSQLRYQPTGSHFESRWLLYAIATEEHPNDYAKLLRLRRPYYLKAHLTNQFPRTFVTQRLTAGRALFFGPFGRRAAAERFESELLDFFGVRRCSENLKPAPDHPGCVYGEMGQCMRPCQQAVSEADYRAETGRLLEALRTQGGSLIRGLEAARDEASAGLEFEQAARLHQKAEKAAQTMRLAEEPARDLDALRAVLIQPSAQSGCLEMWLVDRGYLLRLPAFAIKIDSALPLDGRLRQHISQGLDPRKPALRERADHLALLAQWQFSSWRKGEMVLLEGWNRLPLRRIVNAVSRVYRDATGGDS